MTGSGMAILEHLCPRLPLPFQLTAENSRAFRVKGQRGGKGCA